MRSLLYPLVELEQISVWRHQILYLFRKVGLMGLVVDDIVVVSLAILILRLALQGFSSTTTLSSQFETCYNLLITVVLFDASTQVASTHFLFTGHSLVVPVSSLIVLLAHFPYVGDAFVSTI